MSKKFAPLNATVYVVHDDAAPCRRKGGESCTYTVRWG